MTKNCCKATQLPFNCWEWGETSFDAKIYVPTLAHCIGSLGGRYQGASEIVLNQMIHVSWVPCLGVTSVLTNSFGIGDAWDPEFLWCQTTKKAYYHVAASAWNLYLASTKKKKKKKKKYWRRCANLGFLALPDEITDTTAALSQLNCMVEQLQGYTPDWCNQDYKKQFFGCNVPLLSFGILFQGDLKPAASPTVPCSHTFLKHLTIPWYLVLGNRHSDWLMSHFMLLWRSATIVSLLEMCCCGVP